MFDLSLTLDPKKMWRIWKYVANVSALRLLTLGKKASLLPDKYGCHGILKPALPKEFWLLLSCTASFWCWQWWGPHLWSGLIFSCPLDFHPLLQFLYESPKYISPPDFLSVHWVVGTNSKEIPVGGSVVPTIPKYPSSRISPSALHWWKKVQLPLDSKMADFTLAVV